jgi:hypothetical protein
MVFKTVDGLDLSSCEPFVEVFEEDLCLFISGVADAAELGFRVHVVR